MTPPTLSERINAMRLAILVRAGFPPSRDLLDLHTALDRISRHAEVTVSEVPGQPTIRVREARSS